MLSSKSGAAEVALWGSNVSFSSCSLGRGRCHSLFLLWKCQVSGGQGVDFNIYNVAFGFAWNTSNSINNGILETLHLLRCCIFLCWNALLSVLQWLGKKMPFVFIFFYLTYFWKEKQALKKLENVRRDHEHRLEALQQAQVRLRFFFLT